MIKKLVCLIPPGHLEELTVAIAQWPTAFTFPARATAKYGRRQKIDQQKKADCSTGRGVSGNPCNPCHPRSKIPRFGTFSIPPQNSDPAILILQPDLRRS
jgi:hypothetical protein